MITGLDNIDRKLLNLIQGEFPLSREPFSALGRRLGISGEQLIPRIQRLKAEGIVRQIGPVLDARSLGYQTTLVAMMVEENRPGRAAQVISEHPGVSHGYLRDNRFNLWFTLALSSELDLQSELQKLGSLIGAEATLDLPALRVFKIRALFDVDGDGSALSNTGVDHGSSLHRDCHLSPFDSALINELQQDLPLTYRPFDTMSAHLDMDINEFLDHCRSLQQRGIMRRFGASIRHTSVGFVANAMACWIVPPDIVEVAGRKLAALREVSHCYERRANPIWPYNLFAMIHGHTREACQSVASKLSSETGLEDYVLLFSIKELKKVRVKYLV